jgi:hypothetical protein
VLGDGYELWKPLTDMHIHLNVSNKKYKFLYKRRHKQIINWYENFSKNFNRVLDDIENRNPSIWTKRERKIIFNHYQRSCTFVLKQTHE